MESTLITLVLSTFILMVAINVFFRYKVIKSYNALKKSGIQSRARDFLNPDVLEHTIIPAYPEYEKQIRDYVRYLKRGFGMTSVLLILIFILGFILLKSRS